MDNKNSKNINDVFAHSEKMNKTSDRHLFELRYLIKAVQRLNNTLDPLELYSTISDILEEKMGVTILTIFSYRERAKTFELVFNHGLGNLNFIFKMKEEALWQEILQNEPFSVTHKAGNRLFREFFERTKLGEIQSELWAPLIRDSKVIGLLAIGKKANGRPFDDFDLEFLKQISNHVAICINTCQSFVEGAVEKKDLKRAFSNLSVLYKIARAMAHISDLKSLLKYILGQAIEITKAEKGSLMLYDSISNLLNIRVLTGLDDKEYQEKVNNNQIRCKSFRPGEGVAGQVFQTTKAMVVNKTKEHYTFIDPGSSFVHSIACIPMVFHEDCIGVINVTNKKGDVGFSEEDVETLGAVADQAAVAIDKARLWEMAITDSLTGLYIRRYFIAKLEEELRRAKRHHKVFSVVMADLDNFKEINDTYGHSKGDYVLKIIGEFFKKHIRKEDIIARYGGEEFVVLLPELSKDAAYSFAERHRKGISQLKLNNLPNITLSLGIASFPEDGEDIEGLIDKADTAMYSAKQTGRNMTVKFSNDIRWHFKRRQ